MDGVASMYDLREMQDMLSVLTFANQGHAGRGRARIELDPYRLHNAADAILQADGKGITAMDDRSAPFQ